MRSITFKSKILRSPITKILIGGFIFWYTLSLPILVIAEDLMISEITETVSTEIIEQVEGDTVDTSIGLEEGLITIVPEQVTEILSEIADSLEITSHEEVVTTEVPILVSSDPIITILPTSTPIVREDNDEQEKTSIPELDFENSVVDLTLPGNISDGILINSVKNIEDLPLRLSFVRTTSTSTPILRNDYVVYEDVFENTDVEYKITDKGLKENIILKNTDHPSEFAYNINLENYDYTLLDNILKLYEKGYRGNDLFLQYTISAPYMSDNLGKKSVDIALNVINNELVITPSSAWLSTATYPVIVDPTIEISVLNLHSHPIEGENWNVDFTTVGVGDLYIRPADQATIDEDQFVSLYCGSEDRTLDAQILEGDVIFYPNWSCDEVATVSHLTLKTGNHHLIFEFGDETETVTGEAFNAALIWTGLAGDGLYSTAGNWSTTKVPSAADTVTFDNTCTSCNMTIDVSTTTASFTMTSGYTGTITQNNNLSFNVTGAYSQSAGVFKGGTGTTTFGGAITVSAGTFTPATSTVFNSGSVTININTTQEFYHLHSTSTGTKTISSGDTLVVRGDLYLVDGAFNTGTIDTRGNIYQSSTFDGGDAIVDFGDNAISQTWQMNGGSMPIIRLDNASDASDSIVLNAAASMHGATTTSNFSGTIPISNPSNFAISVGVGDWTQAAGTFNLGSADFSVTSANTGTNFTLSGGTFNGGTGTTTFSNDGGTFTISGGTYISASTTVFTSGGMFGYTVNVNSTQTFEHLKFSSVNGRTVTITSGDTLVASRNLFFTDGAVNTGTVDARSDIFQYSTSDGGTAIIDFGDNAVAQTWTANGGTGPIPRFDSASDANDSIVLLAATGFGGVSITSGFSGTVPISNPSNFAISVGVGDWTQAAGTFNLGSADFSVTSANTGTNFTLSGGTFNGGTGTTTFSNDGGTFTISGGTYNAATTTLFSSNGGFSYTINVPTTQTFANLKFSSVNNQTVGISSGDTLVVTGTLTMIDGAVSTGSLDARGNVIVASTFDGGSAPLLFSGSSSSGLVDQTFDLTGATGLLNADITINKSEGEVRLLSALVLDAASQDLTIIEGTFNLNGQNLTVSGSSGTFPVQDGGTFKLQGGETLTINSGYPTFAASSTVEYTGSSSYTLKGYTYRNLYVSGSGSFSATSGPLTIQKDFNQSAGTFTAAGATTSIAGNITRTGGTFVHNSGTVHLTGTSQTVNDSTTFNNLYKVITSTDTLTFEAGATTTIIGTMTLRGAASNILTLQTSLANIPWYIDPQGTRNILYLDVNDSYNFNATDIIAYGVNSTDGGGNTNWVFEANAPTPGTASITNTEIDSMTINISGASDDTGLASLPYVFRNITNDTYFVATSSTYATSTGLSSGTTYSFEVGVYDVYGNGATTTPVQGATDSLPVSENGGNGNTGGNTGYNNNGNGGSGGGGGMSAVNIIINNGATTTPTSIVNLGLFPPFNASVMVISNSPDFAAVAILPYANHLTYWNLCEKNICQPGIYKVYVKFYDIFGLPSEIYSDDIYLSIKSKADEPPGKPARDFGLGVIITASLDGENYFGFLKSIPVNQKVYLQGSVFGKKPGDKITYRFDCESDASVDGTYEAIFEDTPRKNIKTGPICSYSSIGQYLARVEILSFGATIYDALVIQVGSQVPPIITISPTPPVATTTPPSEIFPPATTTSPIVPIGLLPIIEPIIEIITEEIPEIVESIVSAGYDLSHLVNDLSTSIYGTLVKINLLVGITENLKNNESVTTFSTISLAPLVLMIKYSLVTTDIFVGVKSISDIFYLLIGSINGLMTTLGLRKRRRYWGIVYDSLTKQPLDPAIVKLIDLNTGEVVEQAITDLFGRFGFLDRLGKYKIEVSKTHYKFPSNIVLGNTDNLFTNIYHGEEFERLSIENIIAPNIPMDQLAPDWNQEEKKRLRIGDLNISFNTFILRTLQVLFWIGFIVIFFIFFSKPTLLNSVLIAVYCLLLWLNKFIPDPRLWGKVVLEGVGSPAGLMLELNHPNIPNIVLGKTLTNNSGKFFLKVAPGDYILKVKHIGDKENLVIKETKVTIQDDGVLNDTIIC